MNEETGTDGCRRPGSQYRSQAATSICKSCSGCNYLYVHTVLEHLVVSENKLQTQVTVIHAV